MNNVGYIFITVLYAGLIALEIASAWVIFEKAGQPGWASLIPIYNLYILIMISGKPASWLLLMFVPLVGFIIEFLLCVAISRKFRQKDSFAFGLFLFPVIFIPILAFSDAAYEA